MAGKVHAIIVREVLLYYKGEFAQFPVFAIINS